MRILRILLLLLALGTPAVWGQQSEKVKAPSQTLSAAWAPVRVEHHIGVRGGVGISTARFEPARQTDYLTGLFEGGILYRFDVPSQKYVGTIEFGINYMQKGYIVHTHYDSEDVRSRRYDVISIPILWQPYLPLGKKGSRFYLSAGPSVGYALRSSYREYNTQTGETYAEGPYHYDPTRDNRWEYGLTFGAGFLVGVRSFSLSLEYRYNISLSDTYKGTVKYATNPFRSPVDQMGVTFGLNYRIPRKEKNPATP